MKPTLRILFICILIALKANAQENHGVNYSVFNDTEDLVEAIKGNEIEVQKAILLHYFKDKAEIINFNKVYGPPIFAKLPEIELTDGLSLMATSIQGSNSSLSLIQSKGVDALGTFIANRFKQEINVAFLSKFTEDLDKIPYLKYFFPNSYKVLKQSDPYNYSVFINTLREAFDSDLSEMPENLPTLITELKIEDVSLNSKLQLAASLMNVKKINALPASINYIIEKNDLKLPTSLLTGLKTLSFTLNVFKKNGTGSQSFMTREDLQMLEDNKFRNIYFALLVRQNEKYISDLKITNQDIANLKNLMYELQPQYEALAEQINKISSNNSTNKLSGSDIQKGVSALLNSFENTIVILETNNITTVPTDLKEAIVEGKQLNGIFRLVSDKKYGLALIDLTAFITETLDTGHKITENQKVLLKKYTAFIANCLDAKSKDELVTALETSANPVGSYRIKRNSTFNIALNAYAGGFVGSNFHKDNATVFGFTAPVGLYLGWGNIGKKETDLDKDTGQSFGFFIPVVDVGAVTAFRIQDSETEMADVSWNNVFAPGIYATYGFRKCPISLNAGGQVGPELEKVNSDGTVEFVKKEWYWRFGVVVDISVFDFLISQKAYKLEKQQP